MNEVGIWSAVLLLIIIVGIVSNEGGIHTGHKIVATDCERVSAFYVNDNVYDCSLRKVGD